MGSGKTTIGSRLAKKMGLEFFDCDQEIEKQTGASVNLIFEIEGESGFRKREHQMLKKLSRQSGILVATGGGVIVGERNRKLLRESGMVVYLRTSVAQQVERLRRDRTRPLLQTDNKEKKLMDLAAARNHLYEEVADLVFSVRNRNIDTTVDQLHQAIKSCMERSAANSGTGGAKT